MRGEEELLQMDEEATADEISSWAAASSLVANDDVHLGVAFNKARDISAWLTDNFNAREAFEHFVPQNLELKFR